MIFSPILPGQGWPQGERLLSLLSDVSWEYSLTFDLSSAEVGTSLAHMVGAASVPAGFCFPKLSCRICLQAMAFSGFIKPPKGYLAQLLDESEVCRRRTVEKPEQVLLRWPNPKAIGVASVPAMRLNTVPLTIVAKWWTSHCSYVKTIPVDLLRTEVQKCRRTSDRWHDAS